MRYVKEITNQAKLMNSLTLSCPAKVNLYLKWWGGGRMAIMIW